ncbi:common pilus major fimbrillin subunit EcpA [Pantoea sp. 1.19]|uniref:common pilus major fimbrillin subunit EcpA n=1 Tax=Pantoea sp. 1.19 TaxID=1925589 RepID=UPI000948B6DD|nr:common pilus major fimbrillin subunit EcpA [Pantoea sp. 1.19]
MKKLVITAIGLGSLATVSGAMAASTAMSTAIWQAEAKKNTTNELVVTPTRALQFNYAASTKSFNQDTGTFDVAIRGDHSAATGFKLEARVDDSNNTLRSLGDTSTVAVGAYWGGTELGSSKGGNGGVGKDANWTTLVDSAQEIGSGSGLWALTTSAGSPADTELTARDNFKFQIVSATSDGSTATTFDKLPDGMWQGEVAVAFRATWSK